MNERVASSFSFKKFIHYYITLIIIGGSWLLPAMGPITENGMTAIFTFLGIVYGWSTTTIPWASLVGMISLSCLSGLDTILAAGWGSSQTWLIVIMAFVIFIMDLTGTTTWLVNVTLTRKFTSKNPYAFLFLFYFICGMVACFGGIPILLMFWNFSISICKTVGAKPFDKFSLSLFMGVLVTCTFAGIVLPFQGPALVMLGSLQAATGIVPNYVTFFLAMFPVYILIVLLYLVCTRFVFRADVSLLRGITPEKLGIDPDKITSLTYEQKLSLIAVLWAVFNLFTPSMLPDNFFYTVLMNKVGTVGQAMIPLVIMTLIPSKGDLFYDIGDIAKKSNVWSNLFMMGVLLPAVSIVVSDETGLPTLISNILSSFSGLSSFWFLMMVCLIAGLLTNLGNNMAIGALFLPVVFVYCQSMPSLTISAEVMVPMVMLASSLALGGLPSGSPFCAIIFTYKDWLRSKDIIKYGWILSLIYFFFIIVIALPWIRLIY